MLRGLGSPILCPRMVCRRRPPRRPRRDARDLVVSPHHHHVGPVLRMITRSSSGQRAGRPPLAPEMRVPGRPISAAHCRSSKRARPPCRCTTDAAEPVRVNRGSRVVTCRSAPPTRRSGRSNPGSRMGCPFHRATSRTRRGGPLLPSTSRAEGRHAACAAAPRGFAQFAVPDRLSPEPSSPRCLRVGSGPTRHRRVHLGDPPTWRVTP